MSSLREIAIRDGPDHCDVLKHLNLTLLAPDIVAVILGAVVPLGTAGAVGAGNQGQSRRLVVAEGGHTSSGGYATLRSRMRARLDAGCSGTTNFAYESAACMNLMRAAFSFYLILTLSGQAKGGCNPLRWGVLSVQVDLRHGPAGVVISTCTCSMTIRAPSSAGRRGPRERWGRACRQCRHPCPRILSHDPEYCRQIRRLCEPSYSRRSRPACRLSRR